MDNNIKDLVEALEFLSIRDLPDNSILIYDKRILHAQDLQKAVRSIMKEEKRQIVKSLLPVDGSPKDIVGIIENCLY